MYNTSNAVIRRTAALSVAYLLPTIYFLNEHSGTSNDPTLTNNIDTGSTLVTSTASIVSSNSSSANVTSSSGTPPTGSSKSALREKEQQLYTNKYFHRQQRYLVQLQQNQLDHGTYERRQLRGYLHSFANFNFWNIHLLSMAYCDASVSSNIRNTSDGNSFTGVKLIGKTESRFKVPLDSSLFLPTTNHHDPAKSSCRKITNSTYPANNPSEDRSIFGSRNGWAYGAVFDGHGGWQISDIASKVLLNLIFNKIEQNKTFNEINVEKQIVESFQEMEDIIVESIRPAFHFGFGEVAKVGSCVLLALKKNDHLVIANCGDCRAVLGSIDDQSNAHAMKINREHNCREAFEQMELKREHPNEVDIVVCKNSHACYVKGRLQLTRSLGDAYLKYREFNGSPDKSLNRGRYIPEPYTPPYVSHLPEVTHLRLEPTDRFLILGTDGLWDYLPNAEAVEIVKKGMLDNQKEDEVATRLVERALEIAAEESGMSLAELKKLNPGRNRRSRHDDTTAVVMYF